MYVIVVDDGDEHDEAFVVNDDQRDDAVEYLRDLYDLGPDNDPDETALRVFHAEAISPDDIARRKAWLAAGVSVRPLGTAGIIG